MLTGAVAEALTGVLTGFLTEVLTAEVFSQWAQPCQNGSFWQVPPMGHNLAKTALWGRFRPGRTAAKPSVKTSVKTLKTLSGLKLIVPCQ